MKLKSKSIFKPIVFAIVAAVIALTISPLIGVFTGNSEVPKAEAYEDGYKVRVEIEAMRDDEYLTEAKLIIHTKKDQGRGDTHYYYYESENIAEYINKESGSFSSNDKYPSCSS